VLITLLGWPAVAASVVAVAAGLLSKRPAPILLGAALGLPFFAYVAGTPRFGLAALAPVALQVVAAVVVVRKGAVWAAALCAPAVLLAAYILILVAKS
jgi:hypothetical protein